MQKKLIAVDEETANKFKEIQEYLSKEADNKLNQEEVFEAVVDEFYEVHLKTKKVE